MSDPWDEDAVGGENDWSEESLEADIEEEDPLDLGLDDDLSDDDDE